MPYIMFDAWKSGSSSRACTASLGLLKLTAEPCTAGSRMHQMETPSASASSDAQILTCLRSMTCDLMTTVQVVILRCQLQKEAESTGK